VYLNDVETSFYIEFKMLSSFLNHHSTGEVKAAQIKGTTVQKTRLALLDMHI